MVGKLKTEESSSFSVEELKDKVYSALNEDFNTPIALAHIFDIVRIINLVNDGKETVSIADKANLEKFFKEIVFDVLGLKEEIESGSEKIEGLMKMILNVRAEAKTKKDFSTSDFIRDQLKEIGIEIKDSKEGTSYSIL
jgi:cysteinyl-tRNA synthetase